jgi:hypothetical protein
VPIPVASRPTGWYQLHQPLVLCSPWDYQVFGVCLLSVILMIATEHSVSETGSVSGLRWRGGKHLLYLVC